MPQIQQFISLTRSTSNIWSWECLTGWTNCVADLEINVLLVQDGGASTPIVKTKPIPDGTYYLQISILKMFGNERLEVWKSFHFNIKRI